VLINAAIAAVVVFPFLLLLLGGRSGPEPASVTQAAASPVQLPAYRQESFLDWARERAHSDSEQVQVERWRLTSSAQGQTQVVEQTRLRRFLDGVFTSIRGLFD
jgi:hypothetical protein